MKRSLWLVWLLVLSPLLFQVAISVTADAAELPGNFHKVCASERSLSSNAREAFKATIGKDAARDSRELSACADSAVELIKQCFSSPVYRQVCGQEGQLPETIEELENEIANKQENRPNWLGEARIDQLIDRMNCSRWTAGCVSQAGQSINERCLQSLSSESMRQSVRRASEWINGAATCLSEAGNKTERIVSDVLSRYILPFRTDDGSRLLTCINRSTKKPYFRSRICVFRQNGDQVALKRLDADMSWSDASKTYGAPLRLDIRHGDKTVGFCSGQCINAGGECNAVLTAGHCKADKQTIVTGFTRRGEPVDGEISGCHSVYSGREDWALCRLKAPLRDMNPVSLAVLEELEPVFDTCMNDREVKEIQRCGPGYFRLLAQKGEFVRTLAAQSEGMFYFFGKLLVFNRKGESNAESGSFFEVRILPSGGMSGGGLLKTDAQGHTVVAVHSMDVFFEWKRGFATVIDYRAWLRAAEELGLTVPRPPAPTKSTADFLREIEGVLRK